MIYFKKTGKWDAMKKLTLCLLLVLCGTLIFASCAGSVDTTGTPATDTTAADTTAPTSTTTTATAATTAATTTAAVTTSGDTSSTIAPETTIPETTIPETTPTTTVPEVTETTEATIVIPDPDEIGHNFMQYLADDVRLSSIALPGTHDSGALYDHALLANTAKCQSLTIREQLLAGVKYFDIRLVRDNGTLRVYHGSVDQKQTFDEVLTAFYEYLDAYPSEALIVCIKEEDAAKGENEAFDTMVKAKINENASRWYTQNAIPTLKDARGKLVLMRRFGTSGELGFDASSGFADNSADFTITNGMYTLRCEDYYNNESPEKKWEAVEAFLRVMQNPVDKTYYLCNTSGYKPGLFSIPNIKTISDFVNPKLLSYLESAESLTGIVATDHITVEMAKAIYLQNFQ